MYEMSTGSTASIRRCMICWPMPMLMSNVEVPVRLLQSSVQRIKLGASLPRMRVAGRLAGGRSSGSYRLHPGLRSAGGGGGALLRCIGGGLVADLARLSCTTALRGKATGDGVALPRVLRESAGVGRRVGRCNMGSGPRRVCLCVVCGALTISG